MHRRDFLGLAFAAAILLLAPAVANAYPQWQFSSGTSRCGQCHFAPAGTGLINGYGRDASGDDLSTWQGNGGFLFGAWTPPKWLALGYDGRLAYLSHDVGEPRGAKQAVFPMQADLFTRFAFGESWSLATTVGYRGQTRAALSDGQGTNNAQPVAGTAFASREHYLMWRAQALGPYVRVGRFFAPYGLRLAEHIMYVRRDMGFNLLQESYNLSGGIVQNEWELHATLFAPDVVRHMGGTESGFAAMGERRLGDASALGLQTRIAVGDGVQKYAGGGFGKTYFEAVKTLLMAEFNFQQVKTTPRASNQVIGFASATVMPWKGVWVGPFVEMKQTDLAIKNTFTSAYGGQFNWFPYPHLEFVVLARFQKPSAGGATLLPAPYTAGDPAASTLLAFIHLYL